MRAIAIAAAVALPDVVDAYETAQPERLDTVYSARAAPNPVTNVSSVFVDMAIGLGAPIVPVRFVGGLPREDVRERLEFPFGMGQQDYFTGTPIEPSGLTELAKRLYGPRSPKVLA